MSVLWWLLICIDAILVLAALGASVWALVVVVRVARGGRE